MKESTRTYAALTSTMLFWGLSFIGTKAALVTLHPFALMFLRFASASMLFLVVLARRGFPKIPTSDLPRFALLSLLQPVLYFVCETFGLQLTSASTASLLIASIPVVVLVLARLLAGEMIYPRRAVASVVSIGGIALLVLGDSALTPGESGSFLGDLLILGAVASASLYTLLTRELGRRYSSLHITSIQAFFGTVFFLPFFVGTFGRSNWSAVSATTVGAVVFLAIFATVGAFLTYNYALARIEASRAAIFINGIPVVTTVAAWFLLGESLTAMQIAGGVIVIGSVYFASLPVRGIIRRDG